MNKKIEDAAKQYTNKCHGLTSPKFSYEPFEEYNGFIVGAEWALREAIETLDDWADHYAIDMFPNSVKLTDTSSRDSVSAYVSRHVLNCVKQDLHQLLSSEDKNDKP